MKVTTADLQAAAAEHLLTFTVSAEGYHFADSDTGEILVMSESELPESTDELDEVLTAFVEEIQ